MSYYNQQQPPVGVPPPQGYPPEGYPKDAYPPPGYPQQGYPQQGYPPQGYPPQYAPQYGAPPPHQQQQQSGSTGLMEGCWTEVIYEVENGRVDSTHGSKPNPTRIYLCQNGLGQVGLKVWLLCAVAVSWMHAFDLSAVNDLCKCWRQKFIQPIIID